MTWGSTTTLRNFNVGRNVIPALLIAFVMLAGMTGLQSKSAAAGEVGVINTQGAELFVHPTDLSVIEYMDVETPVDILFGPYEGMYQIRYYGTDGWVWADYLNIGGETAVTNDGMGGTGTETEAPAQAPDTEEHWIDVDRTRGLVTLMVGNTEVNSFWASMGYDTSADGFYSTAIGTYHVYNKDSALTYTPYAKNYITDWVGFDPDRYNGFHSYTKDKNGDIVPNGGGLTGGCVALAPGEIDIVFDFAYVGMRVEVHF